MKKPVRLFLPRCPSSFARAFGASVAVLAAEGISIVACATGNGDVTHGQHFDTPSGSPKDGSTDSPTAVIEDDAGVDASIDGETTTDAETDGGACPPSAAVAVVAGSDTTLSAAVEVGGAPWVTTTLLAGAAKSPPALIAFGTGFLAMTRGPNDALQAMTYGTAWTAATSLGVLTSASPALTPVGAKAQAVYLAPTAQPTRGDFYRAEHSGTAWTLADDPVKPTAEPQSFGPSGGTVAAAGTDIVFAQAGSDEGLYVQVWNGTWAKAAPILGAGTFTSVPPALVAVDGKYDLVLAYADNTVNHVIGFSARDATTKTWTTAAVTHATAQTSSQMSLARIGQFVLLATFRGNNGRPYYMTGTMSGSTISWSTPAPLLPDTSTVDSAPAIAKGTCGDDAVAVFASGGQVKSTRYRGTTWTAPVVITGISGTRVAVATR